MDQTGIDGLYDLDLNYDDESLTQSPSNYPGIATALQEQLGLKLESKKALFDTIIVDHAEKIPKRTDQTTHPENGPWARRVALQAG